MPVISKKVRLKVFNKRNRGYYIRNVAVIAHVDHGKTTLTDSLLATARRLNPLKAGSALATDTMKEEQERGITIASTGVTLQFKHHQIREHVLEGLGLKNLVQANQSSSTSNQIYIGNLPFVKSDDDISTLKHELASQLEAFGQVTIDRVTKRGYAYVTFSTEEQAEACVDASGQMELHGRVISCEYMGQAPIKTLISLCHQKKLNDPKFEQNDKVVELTISDASGQEVFHESLESDTVKSSRSNLALKAISFLSQDDDYDNDDDDDEPAEHPLTVTVLDSPGHVDFSGEVTASLRIADGALVVVDCVDGVGSQTQTVLRQALQERVKPVLFLNKMDKIVKVLQLSPEEAYQKFVQVITKVNEIIEIYQPEGFDFTVDPRDGSVAFGSGLQGWGFTLPQIASYILRSKGKDPQPQDISRLASKLWGPFFVDKVAGKWKKNVTVDDQGQLLDRTFCAMALRPIYAAFEAEDNESVESMQGLAAKLKVELKKQMWKDKTLKELRKLVLKLWMPVADAAVEMINYHLPCPMEAQQYRSEILYTGDVEDQTCSSMKICDAQADMVAFVSKLVDLPSVAGGYVAIARVFSGTVVSGTKIMALMANHNPDEPSTSSSATFVPTRVNGIIELNVGKDVERLHEAFAGQIVGILGVADNLSKTATLVPQGRNDMFPLKMLQFKVSPVVRVAVAAAKPSNTVKLQTTMREMAKRDPCLLAITDEDTGDNLFCGVGELHVEVAINGLKDACGFDVVIKEPVVQYAETVTQEGDVVMTKSRNKHNRLFVKAMPLEEKLIQALEDEVITLTQPVPDRVRILATEFNFDRNLARKIVAIDKSGGNMLIDGTTGLDISPLLDSTRTSFNEVCQRSVLANENLRGTLFIIQDAKMHSDSVHRRPDQICPMARRAFHAAVLSAGPSLLEPVFRVDVQVPDTCLSGLRQVLKGRRGRITEDIPVFGTPLHEVVGELPVSASFGFAGDLRGATSGQASPSTSFSRWQSVEGELATDGSEFSMIVASIRNRKAMKPNVPQLSDLVDRL